MAQLTGNAIQSSYLGLIKTTDNAAIGAVAKAITDGDGNAINMEIGTGAIKFPSGTVDFTGSTVSGLPVDPNTTYDLTAATIGSNINLELTGSDATTDTVQVTAGSNITLTKNITGFVIDAASGGAAGLESGTGTDSMQSASSLTTVAANASAEATIALGDGAIASSSNNIAIGNTANAGGDDSFARSNIAIGDNTDATNEKDIAIGNGAQATGSRTVAVGDGANASGNRAIVIGASSVATAFSSACFGAFSSATAEGATVVGGYGSSATQTDAIAVGKEADALAAGAIAIGKLAQATATDAIALGKDVTGNIASTVSAKALELQTDSTPTAGGIIMSDAGATDRRLNINASGELQVDSTEVLRQTNAYATGDQQSTMSGYGANTYWTSCGLMTGRPGIDGAAVDQNAGTAVIGKFDIDYTKTVNTIGVPMPLVNVSENLYVAIYESASNGGPGVRVLQETKAITASDNNTWVEVALTSAFTPEKGKSYWIGAMTPTGNSGAALARSSGENYSCQRFTTTNNATVGSIIAIHSLMTSTAGTAMPTDLSTTSFNHRDERIFFCWK
tara:strand:- start:18 stop:1709 length:1692 start_codon:yes stop_codon:yes gene_type:complete